MLFIATLFFIWARRSKELAATHWEIPTPANGKSPRRSLRGRAGR